MSRHRLFVSGGVTVVSFMLAACSADAPPEPQGESESHLEGDNECRPYGVAGGGHDCGAEQDCLWLDGAYRCRARPPEEQGPVYEDEAKMINPVDCAMQGHECGPCASPGAPSPNCNDTSVCVYGKCVNP
ncbi:MAG: hypothetical protein U0270_41415 [Labilithrix sp.]